MQIGRSVASWTALQHLLQQLGLVDERDAGVDVEHVGAGLGLGLRVFVTVDRSPLRSSSAKTLRPVGLMRSPMMQKGCSGPIVTVLDRDCEDCVHAAGPFRLWA